jgi:hypothetical protein
VIIPARAMVLLFVKTRWLALGFDQLPVKWLMAESKVQPITPFYSRQSNCVKLHPRSLPRLPSAVLWTGEPLQKGNVAYQCSIAATNLRIPAAVEDRLPSLPAPSKVDTDGAVAHGKLLGWNFGLCPCQGKKWLPNRIEKAILQTCGRDSSSASGVGLFITGFVSLEVNHHRKVCGATRQTYSCMLFLLSSAVLSAAR